MPMICQRNINIPCGSKMHICTLLETICHPQFLLEEKSGQDYSVTLLLLYIYFFINYSFLLFQHQTKCSQHHTQYVFGYIRKIRTSGFTYKP